jgi:cilia- and flagella-associated protein 57
VRGFQLIVVRRCVFLPSIALHPSGLHIAIAFPSYVRLMNILMDDVTTYKELSMKGCTEVKYSNGGQYIAFANSASVSIVATYSCETVCVLRGHTDRVNRVCALFTRWL